MRLLGLLLMMLLMLPVIAQQQTDAEYVTIEGTTYLLHRVEQGETLYSIGKKYQVEQKALVAANPMLINGLKTGENIRIPVEVQQHTPEPVIFPGEDSMQPANFFLHTVEQGDTFYALKQRFGVTKEALLKLNPPLNDGLKVGMIIKVPVSASSVNQQVSVQAEKPKTHLVKRGETLYSIARKYDVDILLLKEQNPELKNRGLINGETIIIPDSAESIQITKTERPTFVQIPVEPVFQKQVVTPDNRVAQLPDNKKYAADCKPLPPGSLKETYRVALFLPLFYERNRMMNLNKIDDEELAFLHAAKSKDPQILKKYFKVVYDPISKTRDTLLVDSLASRQVRKLLPATKSILSFYEGVLIALDSLEKLHIKVQLDLYDTGNSSNLIANVLKKQEFIETDLIIGPVDLKLQSIVSDYAAKNRIPMVAPFFESDELLDNNPYFIQVNPGKEYLMRKTADFISDAYYNKNFVILTLGNYNQTKEFDLVRMLREKFHKNGVYHNVENILFTQVDFTEGGTTGYWQVKKTLRSDMENVIFIPATENRAEREALLSRAINSLNVLADEFDITLVGVSDYPRFKSINTEYFHRLKLHYLTPNYVNYDSPAVNRFIDVYRQNFSAEPDMLSFRGYDLMMYFALAHARFGEPYLRCMASYELPLLQSDYNFQKVSDLGGYMNKSLYVLEYARNFQVRVKDQLTEGRKP